MAARPTPLPKRHPKSSTALGDFQGNPSDFQDIPADFRRIFGVPVRASAAGSPGNVRERAGKAPDELEGSARCGRQNVTQLGFFFDL